MWLTHVKQTVPKDIQREITGGMASSYIFLMENPVVDNESATKQYVDSKLLNISANRFTSGTLPLGRLPAFSGDVTASVGTGTLSLNNVIVTNWYTKVQVDNTGRVVNGGSLIESDIPNLDWTKITSGKPTTLADYGINNALSKNGGTLTGPLYLYADPVNNNQLATKRYVDTIAATQPIFKPGDMIRYNINTVPPGFLRCNGAELSKTMYPDLYAAIGDTFDYVTMPGNGKPWQRQYDFNIFMTEDIKYWDTETSLPIPFAYSQAIVTKNRVYIIGGVTTNSVMVSTVYTAVISNDGTIGAWSTTTPLPVAMGGIQPIVYKNRVYIFSASLSFNVWTQAIYTAPINADGTLGAWSIMSYLPTNFISDTAFILHDRIYLYGGLNGDPTSFNLGYTAAFNADGTLGTFTPAPNLAQTITQAQTVITKNRVYLVGGEIMPDIIASNVVQTATINSDGTLGPWSLTTSLPLPISYAGVLTTQKRVYLFGGVNSVKVLDPRGLPYSTLNYSSDVYTAPINADGTLGTWAKGTSLPGRLASTRVISTSGSTNGRLYLLGGTTDDTYVSTVYSSYFYGGLNDYSMMYNGQVSVTDPNNFKLPSYSNYIYDNLGFVIKY